MLGNRYFAPNSRLLRESGGSIGPVKAGIATEICVAATNDDVALLDCWNHAGISLNVLNATGRTPLHEAVCALCKKSVDYLLSHDVDPCIRDNLGQTAFENALQIQSNVKLDDEKRKLVSAIIAAFENIGLVSNVEQDS